LRSCFLRLITAVRIRSDVEDPLLLRLRECFPPKVKVTLLADRGFADQKLYALLKKLDFEYVIRFRQGITVTSQQAERRTAAAWVPKADRLLKANTSKRLTYAFFRQGCFYYQALPNMREAELRPLIERFAQLVIEHPVFREVFGLV